MAKTVRRKHYVPVWVTRELIWVDYKCAGHVQLEGEARAKQLRWWHEDKGNSWWHNAPKKSFRKEQGKLYRNHCKVELVKYVKADYYEVLILTRRPYPYWD